MSNEYDEYLTTMTNNPHFQNNNIYMKEENNVNLNNSADNYDNESSGHGYSQSKKKSTNSFMENLFDEIKQKTSTTHLDLNNLDEIKELLNDYDQLIGRRFEEKDQIINELKQSLVDLTEKRFRSLNSNLNDANANADSSNGMSATADTFAPLNNNLQFVLNEKDNRINSLLNEINEKENEIIHLKKIIKEQDNVILSHNNNIYELKSNNETVLKAKQESFRMMNEDLSRKQKQIDDQLVVIKSLKDKIESLEDQYAQERLDLEKRLNEKETDLQVKIATFEANLHEGKQYFEEILNEKEKIIRDKANELNQLKRKLSSNNEPLTEPEPSNEQSNTDQSNEEVFNQSNHHQPLANQSSMQKYEAENMKSIKSLYEHQIELLKVKIEMLEKTCTNYQQGIKEMNKSFGYEKQTDELTSIQISKDIMQQLQKTNAELETERIELQVKLFSIKEDLDQVRIEKENLNKKFINADQLSHRLQTERNEFETNYKNQLEQKQNEINQLSDELFRHRTELERVNLENESLTQTKLEHEQLKLGYSQLTQHYEELYVQASEIVNGNQILNDQVQTGVSQINQLEQMVNDYQLKLDHLQQCNCELNTQKINLDIKLAALEHKLKENEQDLKELDYLRAAKLNIEKLMQQNRDLELELLEKNELIEQLNQAKEFLAENNSKLLTNNIKIQLFIESMGLDLGQLETSASVKEYEDLRSQFREAQLQINELKLLNQQMEVNNQTLKANQQMFIEKKEKEIADLQNQINEKQIQLEILKSNLTDESKEKTEAFTQMEESLESQPQEEPPINSEPEKEKNKDEDSNSEYESLVLVKQELEQKIKDLHTMYSDQLNQYEFNFNSVQEENDNLTNELSELKEKLNEFNSIDASYKELKLRNEETSNKVNNLEQQNLKLEAELESLRSQPSAISNDESTRLIGQLEERIAELTSRNDHLSELLKSSQNDEQETLSKQKEALEETIKSLQDKLDSTQQQNLKLKAKLKQVLKQQQQQSAGSSALLLEEQRSTNVTPLHHEHSPIPHEHLHLHHQNETSSTQTELDVQRLENELDSLRSELSARSNESTRLIGQLEERIAELTSRNDQLTEMAKQQAEIESTARESVELLKSSPNDDQENSSKIKEALEETIKSLQDKLDSTQQQNLKLKAKLKQVLKQQQQNSLSSTSSSLLEEQRSTSVTPISHDHHISYENSSIQTEASQTDHENELFLLRNQVESLKSELSQSSQENSNLLQRLDSIHLENQHELEQQSQKLLDEYETKLKELIDENIQLNKQLEYLNSKLSLRENDDGKQLLDVNANINDQMDQLETVYSDENKEDTFGTDLTNNQLNINTISSHHLLQQSATDVICLECERKINQLFQLKLELDNLKANFIRQHLDSNPNAQIKIDELKLIVVGSNNMPTNEIQDHVFSEINDLSQHIKMFMQNNEAKMNNLNKEIEKLKSEVKELNAKYHEADDVRQNQVSLIELKDREIESLNKNLIELSSHKDEQPIQTLNENVSSGIIIAAGANHRDYSNQSNEEFIESSKQEAHSLAKNRSESQLNEWADNGWDDLDIKSESLEQNDAETTKQPVHVDSNVAKTSDQSEVSKSNDNLSILEAELSERIIILNEKINEIVYLNDKVKYLEDNLKLARLEIDEFKSSNLIKLTSSNQEIENNYLTRINNLENELNEKKQNIELLNFNLNDLNESLSQKTNEYEYLLYELKRAQNELADVYHKNEELNTNIEQLKSKESDLNNELDSFKKKYDNLRLKAHVMKEKLKKNDPTSLASLSSSSLGSDKQQPDISRESSASPSFMMKSSLDEAALNLNENLVHQLQEELNELKEKLQEEIKNTHKLYSDQLIQFELNFNSVQEENDNLNNELSELKEKLNELNSIDASYKELKLRNEETSNKIHNLEQQNLKLKAKLKQVLKQQQQQQSVGSSALLLEEQRSTNVTPLHHEHSPIPHEHLHLHHQNETSSTQTELDVQRLENELDSLRSELSARSNESTRLIGQLEERIAELTSRNDQLTELAKQQSQIELTARESVELLKSSPNEDQENSSKIKEALEETIKSLQDKLDSTQQQNLKLKAKLKHLMEKAKSNEDKPNATESLSKSRSNDEFTQTSNHLSESSTTSTDESNHSELIISLKNELNAVNLAKQIDAERFGDEITRFDSLLNEKIKENQSLKSICDDLEQRIRYETERLENLLELKQKTIDRLNEEINLLNDQIDNERQRNQEHLTHINQSHLDQLNEKEAQLNDMRTKFEAELLNGNENLNQQENMHQDLKTKINELESLIQLKQDQVDRLNQDVSNLHETYSRDRHLYETNINSLKESLNEQITSNSQQLTNFKAQFDIELNEKEKQFESNLRNQKEKYENELNFHKNNEKLALDKYGQLERLIDLKQKMIDDLVNQSNELKHLIETQRVSYERKLNELNTELNDLKLNNNKFALNNSKVDTLTTNSHSASSLNGHNDEQHTLNGEDNQTETELLIKSSTSLSPNSKCSNLETQLKYCHEKCEEVVVKLNQLKKQNENLNNKMKSIKSMIYN